MGIFIYGHFLGKFQQVFINFIKANWYQTGNFIPKVANQTLWGEGRIMANYIVVYITWCQTLPDQFPEAKSKGFNPEKTFSPIYQILPYSANQAKLGNLGSFPPVQFLPC